MKTVRFVFHFLLLAAVLGSLDRSAPPPDARDPVAISPRIGELIMASRRAEATREASIDSLLALRVRLEIALDTTGETEAALDSLRAAWRRDPGSFALIHLANLHRAQLGQAFMTEMMAHPVLTSSTAAGLYVRGGEYARGNPAELDTLLMANDAAAGRTLSERAWLGQTLCGALDHLGRNADAIAHLDTMLPALRDAGLRPQEARAWWTLVKLLRRADRPGDALAASRRCEEMALGAGMRYQALSTLADRAQALDDLGRTDLMLAVLNEMERGCRRVGIPSLRIVALNRLSNQYAFLGEPEAALRMDQEVLRTLDALGDSTSMLYTLLNIADGHMRTGHLDSAAAALDSAGVLLARRPDPRLIWTVPSERSLLEGLRGDFAAADSLARLADSLAPGRRDSVQEAQRLLNLVDLGQRNGRPDVAWRYLHRLEDYRRLAPSRMTGFDAVVEIDLRAARLALETGFPERAAPILARLATALGDEPAPVLECQVEELRGRQQASTDPAASLVHYRRALAAAGRCGRPALENRLHGLLAWALLDQKRWAEARDHALALGRHLDPDPGHRPYQERRVLEASIARARGESRHALEMIEDLRSAAGPKLQADLALLADVERGCCLRELGEHEAALAAFRQAMGRPAAGPESERVSRGRRRAALAAARLVVDHPGLAGGDPAAASRNEWLAGLSGDGATPLPPGGCCAVIALDEPTSHLWTLAGGTCRRRDLPPNRVIQRAAGDLRLSLGSGAASHRVAADSLGAWLLEPIGDAWVPGGTLQVLPDRGLDGLPWPALNCGGRPVVERGPVVEVVAEAGLPGDGRLPEGGALLALAFGPAEAAECRAVAARWPWRSLVIEDPGRALAALTEPPSGDWRVLHVSARVTLRRGPGGLTAVEFGSSPGAPLSLAAIGAAGWNPDLVFLSCCAGLGANGREAGVPGDDLAHTFLASGARAVIAAGGVIYEKPARDMAAAFYGAWLEEHRAEVALWRARCELRSGPWPEPGHWARHTLLRRWR